MSGGGDKQKNDCLTAIKTRLQEMWGGMNFTSFRG
jgi:hypothetical protein